MYNLTYLFKKGYSPGAHQSYIILLQLILAHHCKFSASIELAFLTLRFLFLFF